MDSCCVGKKVGTPLGSSLDGSKVVGRKVGIVLGSEVVGPMVGPNDGSCVGSGEVLGLGKLLGEMLGVMVSFIVGSTLGINEVPLVGIGDGAIVEGDSDWLLGEADANVFGEDDGATVGTSEGEFVREEGCGEPPIGFSDGEAVGIFVGNALFVDPELGEEVLFISPVGVALGSTVGPVVWPNIVGTEEGLSVLATASALGDWLVTAVGSDDIDGIALDVGAPVGPAVIVGAPVMVGARLGTILVEGAFVLFLLFFEDFFPDLD